jgi:rod shape-determining protein MreC
MASYSESPEEARGRRELTAAVVFFLLALVVLYLPGGVQSQVAATFRATLLRPFLFTQETLAQARLRAEEAGNLQTRLDSLASKLAAQAPLVDENRRLRELLELRERAPAQFLPASVIRPGTPGSESMFLLDVGSEQGVEVGDPVIMREGRIGLVGVIQQVRRGSAIGLDWSHPDFRASAMAEDGSVYGIVEPLRGLFRENDRLLIDGIPFYEELEEGSLITTSGLGGIYPRGIPIGVVGGLYDEEGSWRTTYFLRPIVETGSVRHVLVVLGDEVPDGVLELFSGEEEGSARPDSAGGPGPNVPLPILSGGRP